MEPDTPQDLEKKPEDFVLAGLTHLSFFAGHLAMSGTMFAITQSKSEYAGFQAAQAFAAQLVGLVFLVGYIVFFMVFVFATTVFAGVHPNSAAPALTMIIFPIHFLVIFGVLASHVMFAAVGMIRCFQGRDWVIPGVGAFVFARWFRGKRAPAVPAT